MPNEIIRDAHVIAQEINYIKERTKREVLRASIEIGFKLIEAKALVAHGEWEQWLEENVNYSQSTANNLMKVAKEYGSDQVDMLTGKVPSDVFAEVSYTKALSLLSLPMDERIEMVESGVVDNMSTRELDEAIKARKSAEEKSQALEDDLKNERSSKDELQKRIAELESDLAEMKAVAEAPAQVDMEEHLLSQTDYILRSDADNERIIAVTAARKESAEAIEKANAAAEKAKAKADKLKAQLETAEASAAEKVKAEYESALAESKARTAELSEKLERAANPAVQRFAIYFEELKEVFEKLLACVDEAEDGDRQRLRDGVRKVLASMAEVVEE